MKSEVLRNELLTDKNKSRLGKTMGPDYTGHNLVFIVGCGRSGTTWLQRLLASHPKIRTGQETHIFSGHVGSQLQTYRACLNPQKRGGIGLGCYFTEDKFLHIVKSFLVALLEPMVGPLKPGELFVEKTPLHSRYIPEIEEFLPESRILHILRDPRDVVASFLAASKSWGSDWAPRSAATAAHRWVTDVRLIREAAKNLPSWQFHEVRYEALHMSPKFVLKGCTDFLGLEWDDEGILQAIEANERRRAMAGGGGTAIPLRGEVGRRTTPYVIEPEGFIRKAEVGSWKTDLNLWEKFWTWKVAGKLMAEVGYDWPLWMELPFKSFAALTAVPRRAISSGLSWKYRSLL